MPAPRGKIETPAQIKRKLLDLIAQGYTVEAACRSVNRSAKTYEAYRASDPEFRDNVDHIRALRASVNTSKATGSFADWSKKYLGAHVFAHQQQWIDLLEGRPPSNLHPAQTYEPGRRELLIVNTPPEHAKSTTITAHYALYRICQDPNVRIIIVSKTKEMAKKFVYQIKNRLTHPAYRQLQMDFGPPGGFQAGADSWTADMIYLGADSRDSGEKDPTLLALGIGGQIYGARADLIIVDDAVTLSNAHEFEKQIDWLTQEVLTRLSDTGKLLVVGTRVAPQDLYSELRDGSRWVEGRSEWTYMCQPAVLEFAEDPKDWVTLWPQTNNAAGELVPKWDGPALYRRRGVIPPRTWSMVYMQQQVVEDAVFRHDAVKASVNGMRKIGPIPKGATNCRPEGMDGLYVVAGLDPAAAGNTAMVVLGVDRQTKKRYVLEVLNQPGMTPTAMREAIKSLTERLGVMEWRIEKNAFQTMLTQDAEIREFLASRGCLLKEHQTGSNKWDADFGVASMALLFDGHEDGRQLIELPSTEKAEGVKSLVEQLITWAPETKNKTDTVMALWFAEIRAREIVDVRQSKFFSNNSYLTAKQQRERMVVNIDDYLASRGAGFL